MTDTSRPWIEIWPEDWPKDIPKLKPLRHTLFRHDFMFMVVEHDIACPVCFENKARFHSNHGLAMPCPACSEDGWRVAKLPKWVWWIFGKDHP